MKDEQIIKNNSKKKKSLLEIGHGLPTQYELEPALSLNSVSKEKLYNNSLYDQCLDEIPEDQKAAFELNYRVAAMLTDLLEENGMTPHELAWKLGKGDAEVAEWLTGRHDFTLRTIANIEVALSCKLIKLQRGYENVRSLDIIMDELHGKPGSPEREAFRKEAAEYVASADKESSSDI